MTIFSPLNEIELRNMMFSVQDGSLKGPIAIRYPRGKGSQKEWQLPFERIIFGKGRKLQEGSEIAVLSFGAIGQNVIKALRDLPQQEKAGHYDMRFAKPLDEELLHEIFQKYKMILTIEDGVLKGGFGSAVMEFAQENNYHLPVKSLGLPDRFFDHGKVDELQEIAKIDVDNIRREILTLLQNY
jgi:1-deoxy-D-xylulose-5-phosphate synthase